MSEQLERVVLVIGAENAEVKKAAEETVAQLRRMSAGANATSKEVAGIGSRMGDLLKQSKSLAGLFGVGFGATAIVRFADSVFNAAEQITDLSNKLQVSTEWLQRMKFAAEQSGASVETVSTAIVQMSDKLASGDSAAAAALASMNLHFKTLRAMRPEDAFNTIATAIREVPDAMKQVQIARDVFGKSGADLLPGIREDILKLGEGAAVMSDRTIKELDRAKDAWGQFGTWLTVKTGEAIANIAKIFSPDRTGMYSSRENHRLWAIGYVDKLLKSAGQGITPTLPYAGDPDAQEIGGFGSVLFFTAEKYAAAAKQAADAANKNAAALKKQGEAAQAAARAQRDLIRSMVDYAEQHQYRWDWTIRDLDTRMARNLFTAGFLGDGNPNMLTPAPLNIALGDTNELFRQLREQFDTYPDLLVKGPEDAKKVNKELNNTVIVAGGIADSLRTIARNFDGSTRQGLEFGAEIVRMFEMVEAGATAAQMAMTGVTFGLNLAMSFMAQQEAQLAALQDRFNEVRSELIALNGEIPFMTGNNLTAQTMQLQHEIDVLEHWQNQLQDGFGELSGVLDAFGGQIPVQLKPMIDAMLQSGVLFGEQKELLEGLAAGPSWEALAAAAERYELSLDSLGAGFQQLKSNDLFDQFFSDWTMFAGVGADMNAVLAKMGPQIQQAMVNAQQYGINVPEYMRPVLEAMLEQGMLLDENGNALADLSSIEFDDTIQSSLAKVEDAILELIVALKALGGTGLDEWAARAKIAIGRVAIDGRFPTATGRGGERGPWDIGRIPFRSSAEFNLEKMLPALSAFESHVRRASFALAAVPVHAVSSRPLEVTVNSILDGRQIARTVTIHQPDEAHSLRYR